MENYLDYKATIWFRIPIENEGYLNKIKSLLEQGDIPDDLYSNPELDEIIGPCEELYETEEFMRVTENDGHATLELFSNGELLWDNSYESELKRRTNND